MWHNKYIGITYEDKGRTAEGTDCWGLARLIYKEEFNIDLPSFDSNYAINDTERIQELVSQFKEGWQRTEVPEEGNIVLFKMLGHVSHIGVMVSATKFIHNRRGTTANIESIDSPRWKHRFAGTFKYTEAAAEDFNKLPPSLVAHKIEVPPGMTIAEAREAFIKNAEITEDLKSSIFLYLNGKPVDNDLDYALVDGDSLEYRLVPQGGGGDLFRTILIIAVTVAAIQVGAWVSGTSVVSGLGTGLGAGSIAGAAATMAVQYVGMALVNAIAPLRPPDQPNMDNPGQSNPQLVLSGASNSANKYGSIPIVLGKYRINAMLAANNILEVNTDESYLRMLLTWGYGPVYIDDIRVGPTPFSSYSTPPQYAGTNGYLGESLAGPFSIYGWADTYQEAINLELTYLNQPNNWVSRVIPSKSTNVSLSLHFPEGLRGIYREGPSAGNIFATAFVGEVNIRRLDDALQPVTGWMAGNIPFGGRQMSITAGSITSAVYSSVKGNDTLVSPGGDPINVWNYVYVTSTGDLAVAVGAGHPPGNNTENPNAGKAYNFWGASGITPYVIPQVPSGSAILYRIDVGPTAIYQIIDDRASYGITGAGLTVNSLDKITVADGVFNGVSTLVFGLDNQPYCGRKDAFTHTVNFNNLGQTPYYYEVRVRRANPSDSDLSSSGKPYLYHKCIYQLVTAIDNTVQPVTIPSSLPLAVSGIRIKATDQLNGGIEAINAIVRSICLDYDIGSNTWVSRPTSNPASLLRYVLQHPGNTQKVSDSELDLTNLQTWHTFCRTNYFEYNGVTTDQRSLLEVMKDIAAAGRASPIKVNGKWGVTIDTYKTEITQHFTPKNSWGFESSRTLSMFPHGLKVTFINPDREYQSEETIIYADGYNSSNATLFETIQLPGVVGYQNTRRHARFHLAQAKLRPEKYTLNTDMEYLVCTRGDLVRVSHDVPMWGTATGRIKNNKGTVSNITTLELDESVYLLAGTTYTIRIRTATGTSVTRTVSAIVTTQDYKQIDVYPSLSTIEAAADNLFMIGTNSTESVELIVLSIEPAGNMNAKLTLVDYAPAIFTADTQPIPAFNSKITQQPARYIKSIFSIPVIDATKIKSDESVMELSGSSYVYKLVIPYTNPAGIETSITRVQFRICLTKDTSLSWRTYGDTDLKSAFIAFTDVIEGYDYSIQARYVSDAGAVGPWSGTFTHTIVGKTTPPANVTNFTASVASSAIDLKWDSNKEIDFGYYEIRSSNTNWGTSSGMIFAGKANKFTVNPTAVGVATTWYIKAVDVAGNYSATATSVTFTVQAPSQVSNVTYLYSVLGTGQSTVTITWTPPTPNSSQFDNKKYLLSFVKPGLTMVVSEQATNYVTFNADWEGTATLNITTVDTSNNQSTAFPASIIKVAPSAPTSPVVSAKGSILNVTWTSAAQGSLPVAGYQLSVTNTLPQTNPYIYKGSVSNIDINTFAATNTWYLWAYDTAGKYSTTPLTVTKTITKLSAPQTVTGSFTDTTALFKWKAPATGDFAVDHYDLTLTAIGMSTLTASMGTTEWEIPVGWTNTTATLTVVPVDVSVNAYAGTSAQTTLTKAAPNAPTTATLTVIGTDLDVDWPDNSRNSATQLAVFSYEIKDTLGNSVWRGAASKAQISLIGKSGTLTYNVYAYDFNDVISAATSFNYTVVAPTNVTAGTITTSFGNSLTDASLDISWGTVTTAYGLDTYEITYDSQVIRSASNTITISPLPTGWIGNKTFTIKSVDLLGNKSSGTSVVVNKLAPNAIPSYSAQVIDNNVMLYWGLPDRTSLPIAYVRIKKGTSWASGELIGDKNGTFTTIFERKGGNYTYWIAAVDTDKQEGAPISFPVTVSQPPDFVYSGDLTSAYTGTLSNALVDQGKLVLPVDLTTQYGAHFTNNSWTTPNAQIVAGYPVYIQPTLATSYYEEVFDFGTTIGSTQVTLTLGASVIDGAPVVVTALSTSNDNITFTNPYSGTSIFATNFRYVKVRVTVTQNDSGKGLYSINYMNVRLDSKIINWSGISNCLTTDVDGTLANFGKEFVDVSAIQVSPSGNTPLYPVYDFKDAVLSGTYVVSGNVCTVTTTVPHGFSGNAIGQQVRLSFNSGTAPNGIYAITSVSGGTVGVANSYASSTVFTVAITTANTSGSLTAYSEGMRIYLYNGSGTRAAGSVTWAVRGY